MDGSRFWLITGASSGFGLELVKFVASRGERVIAATRSPQKLDGLPSVTVARLDHNEDLKEVKVAIRYILQIHGTIDVVVNNAAYVQTGMIEETTPEETFRQFQANTFGPLNKRTGTLITIGSMAAWYPMPSCNLYNSSKAALRWLTIGLAGEVKQFGIKHCLIEPGFFRTELLRPRANLQSTIPKARISDYAELNATADGNFKAFHGSQLGDPTKAAQIIYDVVTSSGIAVGRELPSFIPLGSDASREIANTAQLIIDDVNEWASIAEQRDIKDEE